MIESIILHSDFAFSNDLKMNILSSGTVSIIPEVRIAIGLLTPLSITSSTYSSQTVTYSEVKNRLTNVYYQTNDQSFTITEVIIVLLYPKLPWSSRWNTPISFIKEDYISSAPICISVDSNTDLLNKVALTVNTATDYIFF